MTGRRLDIVRSPLTPERPTNRSQCRDGSRPCPFVSCRYHLYLDVQRDGSLKIHFKDREVDEIPQTCALDVADAGSDGKVWTLQQCGELFNVSRERIRQIEAKALQKLDIPASHLREHLDSSAEPSLAAVGDDHVSNEQWSDRQYIMGGGEAWHMRRSNG